MGKHYFTKRLKDYTDDELKNICHHYNSDFCANCPIDKLVIGSPYCPATIMSFGLTVEESDLKDG